MKIAYVISTLLFCLLAIVFAQGLSTGENFQYDEYYAMERSAGFEKYHDWLSVYSSNERSAKKPPLHYWMNAICLKAGVPELLAFRLPSYLFLMGSIAFTAILCRLLCRDNPWALPAGILLSSSSILLLKAGRSAMLDAGLCFFILCALLGFFRARENPRWWYFCGISIGLGALQKAPVGFLFITILLIIMNIGKDEYYRWKNLWTLKPFKRSLRITIVLLLSWPLLQTFRYGVDYVDVAIRREMLKRMAPLGGDEVVNTDPGHWFSWLWHDIHYLAIAAVVCLLLLFANKRLRKNNDLLTLGLLTILVGLSFSLATGKIYPRYLVALSPLLIVISVKVASDTIPWKPAVAALALLVTVAEAGHIRGSLEGIHQRDTLSRSKRMVALLEGYLSPEDHAYIDRGFLQPGAYGYFGKSTQPYLSGWINRKHHHNDIRRRLSKRTFPVVGISSPDCEEDIKTFAEGYSRLYADDEVLIWRFEKPEGSQ